MMNFKGNIGMEYVSHQRQAILSRINHQHSPSLGSTSPSPFLWAGFGGPGRWGGRGGAIIHRWSWGVLVSQYIKKRPEGCNNSRNHMILPAVVFQTRIIGGPAAPPCYGKESFSALGIHRNTRIGQINSLKLLTADYVAEHDPFL